MPSVHATSGTFRAPSPIAVVISSDRESRIFFAFVAAFEHFVGGTAGKRQELVVA
ncbi:hypothetical protein [Nucisporomicrobium flavum]|uniref:hypothetical protein n=1 Tax=Nucisporomicrobium flavum TaxID=2785915 RepID=UPI0018F3553D|nr:hypothetical protein [Nucisporomicrobium flavum]